MAAGWVIRILSLLQFTKIGGQILEFLGLGDWLSELIREVVYG